MESTPDSTYVGTRMTRINSLALAVLVSLLPLSASAQGISLLSTQTPQSSTGKTAAELGLRLSSTGSGRITTIKFWKLVDDKGTHVGKVWSASGTLLTSVTFATETAAGWQQQVLATPFALGAGVVVTVSVNTNTNGHFAVILNGLTPKIVNGPLATIDGRSSASGWPNALSLHNYFRDIVFVPDPVPVVTLAPIATPSANTPLSATITNGPAAAFAVDGKPVALAAVAQFTSSFDASTLAAGSHTLTVSVLGVTTSTSFTIVSSGPTLVTSYVSDRPWLSAANGWGPIERDTSNGEQAAGDGHPLTIGATVYAKGLGVHPASDVAVALAGQCRTFTAQVGVDAEELAAGPSSVQFQVLVDGVSRYQSAVLTNTTPATPVSVDVTGALTLDLVVTDGGDGNSYDHADWADAKLACLPDTTAPTIASVNPVDAATGIASNTTVTAVFSEAMTAATITASSVTLKQGTAAVSSAVTYDGPSKSLTLTPSAALAATTLYTVTIAGGATGVKDASGNALAVAKTWSFTTAAASTIAGVPITAGQDIMAAVNANPAGTAFALRAGVYRLQTITPKPGDTFTGEAGTVLSGAKVLTGATGTGPWIYTGQTQEGTFVDAGGFAYQAGHQAEAHPEDLYFDNGVKEKVNALTDGVPGKWFFDYPNDTIYVWDNPAGHVVETSVTPTAIASANTAATFQALTIEKYASITQTAAIVLGPGAVMKGCEVRWNHYAGIETGPGSTADTNFVHHNGVFGFIGSGNPLVVNNEIAYNNTVFGDPFWGAGGSKWVYADGLIVRGNFSHHNLGPGLWTDINNINVLYENNRVEDNARGGIMHEISYGAIIRNNQIARNGTAHLYAGWPTEGGIAIVDSANVEVSGNTLVDNWGGIAALQDDRSVANPDQNHGIWEVRNLNVHDNTVTSTAAIQQGAGMNGLVGPAALFSSMGNAWRTNHYILGANPNYFMWAAGGIAEAAWKAAGQDVSGTFTR